MSISFARQVYLAYPKFGRMSEVRMIDATLIMHEEVLKHRLFVGGLFPSVKDQDIREKFQNFGEVTDVEVIQRKDEYGNATKTFAYVDMVTKVAAVNKCFSLFGGTKWKGHELKVQIAKENFIERLRKERLDPNYYEKKRVKRKAAILDRSYDDIVLKTTKMKKAVPGTMVEGERDWVIGKYGRPLPVVSIKSRIGARLMKFDPSKHCHCLKRIADDERVERNIENLTWFSDESSGILSTNRTHKRKVQSEIKKKSSNEPSKKLRKHHSDIIHNRDVEQGDSMDDAISSNVENVAQEQINVQDDNVKRRGLETEVTNEVICLSVSIIDQLNEKLKSEQTTNVCADGKTIDNDLDASFLGSNDFDASLPGSMFDFDFDSLQSNSDQKQSIASLNKTDITSVAILDGESEKHNTLVSDLNLETTEKISSTQESVWQSPPSTSKCHDRKNAKTGDEDGKRSKAKRTDNSEKKLLSEEARQNSIESRSKKNLFLKETVSAALKQVDAPRSSANRIVFQDSSDEDVADASDDNLKAEQAGFKGTTDRSGSSHKKDLFDDTGSDDDDDDDDDEKTFQIKTQFQGKRGEELFKLQQKFGGDVRFQMDERFADDDDVTDELVDDMETRHDDECDDNNEEETNDVSDDRCVKKEKEHNLKLLEQVLNTELPVSKTENFFFERYDPTNDDHQKYEIPKKKEEKVVKEENVRNDVEEKKTYEEESAPVVSTEKFYQVDESLSTLFGSSTQENNGFSFLGVDENPEDNINEPDSIQLPVEEIRQEETCQVDDQPTVQSNDVTNSKDADRGSVAKTNGWKFFFADDDERFELGKRFLRTQAIDTITNEWNSGRSELHQDYKKKHKDALRRVRKLKEKKFSRK